MKFINLIMVLSFAMLMTSCDGNGDGAKTRREETVRKNCLNMPCEGDVYPKAPYGYRSVKLNGRFFLMPKDYIVEFGGLAFHWPSKAPGARNSNPETGVKIKADFRESAILMFFTSFREGSLAGESYRSLVGMRMRAGFGAAHEVRPGLLRWQIFDQDGKPREEWYELKDVEPDAEMPPVLRCFYSKNSSTCYWGGRWRPDISLGMRFSARHASDWNEIFSEAMRLLRLVREV